jgi:hypothetical protein
MPVITARLSIDTDSIIDAGFMRLKLKVLTYYVRRAQGASNAIISSLAAGLMAFFTGVVVPITLWEKFSSHRNEPSADAPVVFFSLIFGVILALVAFAACAWWLWPSRDKDMDV